MVRRLFWSLSREGIAGERLKLLIGECHASASSAAFAVRRVGKGGSRTHTPA